MKVAARELTPPEPRARAKEDDAGEGGFGRFLKESSVRVVIEERSRSVVHESQVAHLVALLNRPELRDINTSPLIEVLKRVADSDLATGAVVGRGEGRPHLVAAESAPAPQEERERDDELRRPTAAEQDAAPHAVPDAVAAPSDPAPGAQGNAPVTLGPVEARESVQQALAVLDDPASWATLDKNAALMVVDGLHIRLTTHDGAAAVTVEGQGRDGLIARAEELREAMGQSGIELQRLTAPGANADAQLDRRGAAVVDVNDDFDDAADGFFNAADINVTA